MNLIKVYNKWKKTNKDESDDDSNIEYNKKR
jgi:hypothetical protein